MNDLALSICMPTRNGSLYVKAIIACLLQQDFQNFELIVCDDGSKDNTCAIVESFRDSRIRLVRNKRSVGYGKNLERCRRHARNDILVFMGQDDIICDGMLRKIHDVFTQHPEVGALTRAYYWFHGDIQKPVRVKPPVDQNDDAILSLTEAEPKKIYHAFSSMDQLSGLALRREWIDSPVHEHIFTAHVYPIASIWKKHALMCLKDYTVAVRIEQSGSVLIFYL